MPIVLPDLAGLFTEIETRLTAAGAACTPAITQIQAGELDALNNTPVIAYWLLPIEKWQSDTLAFTQRTIRIQWMVYIPGTIRSNKTTNLNTELRLAAAALAIEASFMDDVTMAGKATGKGLELTAATPGWIDVGKVRVHIVTGEVGFYMTNVAPISGA